jgi:hypothetical protein
VIARFDGRDSQHQAEEAAFLRLKSGMSWWANPIAVDHEGEWLVWWSDPRTDSWYFVDETRDVVQIPLSVVP